jgi:hypothetical protein
LKGNEAVFKRVLNSAQSVLKVILADPQPKNAENYI